MLRPRAIALPSARSPCCSSLAPFVPRGDDDGRRAAAPPATGPPPPAAARPRPPARRGSPPQMQAEIDRVVAETGRRRGSAPGPPPAAPSPRSWSPTWCSCAELRRPALLPRRRLDRRHRGRGAGPDGDREPGQRAASHDGGRDHQHRRPRRGRRSGPAGPDDPRRARDRAERAELEDAARSVAKVWLLRHEIQGVPLPADFLAEHPEAAAPGRDERPDDHAAATRRKTTRIDYPADRSAVLSTDRRVDRADATTYWCGPTSMQMIAWGWTGQGQHSQQLLGQQARHHHAAAPRSPTWCGWSTASTGWDSTDRAGTYITLDIGD